MNTFYITVVVGGIALAGLVFYSQRTLAHWRRMVEQNWSPLERHLAKRHDIAARLAELAQAPLANDPNTPDDVLSLIDTLGGALTIEQRVEFENRLTQAIRALTLVGDSSPELRGDGRYHGLKQQLAEAELQITQAGRFYNVSAKDYNQTAQKFPHAFVASYLGYGRQPYLQTTLTESEAGFGS